MSAETDAGGDPIDVDRITKRREAATANCTDTSFGASYKTIASKRKDYQDNHPRTGIAFSGGGIRSATICLVITEALAARGRFYAIDMMSTVSGGGYFGTFLRALFVEREAGAGKAENERLVSDRFQFADAVLRSLPDLQYFRGKSEHPNGIADPNVTVKNPLWWLRENGRYLAPNGMSDYAFALAYIVRNWVAMILAILIAFVCAWSAIQLGLVGLRSVVSAEDWTTIQSVFAVGKSFPRSPLLVLTPVLVLVGWGFGLGYWISMAMPYVVRPNHVAADVTLQKRRFWLWWVFIAASAAALFAGFYFKKFRHDATVDAIVISALIILGASILSSLCIYLKSASAERRNIAAEFRRRQTSLLSTFNNLLLVLLAIGLIDSLAIRVQDGIATSALVTTGGSALLAWLIAKIPDWLDGKGKGLVRILSAYAPVFALIASGIMLIGLATTADLLVIKVLWTKLAWDSLSYDWSAFAWLAGLSCLLFALIGLSHQFLNLTALAPLYASRLTRAYVGASNFVRLDANNDSDITVGMSGDNLSLVHYMTADVAAPLHLINVTLNRTIGSSRKPPAITEASDDNLIGNATGRVRGRLASYESALVLRDRHGDRMVFGPYGMRAGAQFFSWNQLKRGGAEDLLLGQLCAISGAAVSSGMGRHTSLGTSMALTLANVRLGQWWRSRALRGSARVNVAHSYDLLLCEMLARFGRDKDYWYLTDGGHSENSGALSLLERGCKFILVADNGEDPRYEFADLEVFVRTARTDIGLEVEVAARDDFPGSIDDEAAACFFNGGTDDWRVRAQTDPRGAFALLLRARDVPLMESGHPIYFDETPCWIVWLKPSRFAGLPTDIATYSDLNPDFPQQSTGNQFFDEAQWESYRRMGFTMGVKLFHHPKVLAEFLPIIFQNNPRRPPPGAAPPGNASGVGATASVAG